MTGNNDGHDGRRRSARGRPCSPRHVSRDGISVVRLLPGGNWHILGTYLGTRLRESTFTRDLVQAEQQLQRRLKQIADAFQGRGQPPKATYGEANMGRLAERLHSAHSIADCAKWEGLIGADTLCEDVDWAMVRRLAMNVLKPGFQPATLKRTVVEVRAVLIWANRNLGLKRGCPPPNFPTLEDGKRREVYLTPRHCKAMHAVLLGRGDQLAADVLCVAVCEGPRREELVNMQFEFADLQDGVFTLRGTKSSSLQHVRDRVLSDLRPWALGTLRSIEERRGGKGSVFLKPDGTMFPTTAAFGRYVNTRLQWAAKEVGVVDWKQVGLHVLRHTAATNHYLLTGDIHDVQRRFDWYDAASAERYLKKVPKVYARQAAELYGLDGFWQSPEAKAWVSTGQSSDITK